MGKKIRPAKPDPDGVLRTGIYQRRVVRLPKTDEELDADFQALWESLQGPKQTIHEWLNGCIQEIVECVTPYLQFDDQIVSGSSYLALPIPGQKLVRVADNISAEWHEYVNDANEAVTQIRILKHHIAEDDSLAGELQWVVQNAYQFGRTVERMQIRPFEPIVATELSRRKKRGIHRKHEKRLSDSQLKVVMDYVKRRTQKGDTAAKACSQASAQLLTGTFPRLKGKAIEISAKRLQNIWSKWSG
jgi:hypothetical protein